jgi:diphosphomevalonate decarboxylase
LKWDIKIESKNNFNTAAGLASSSSGLSCLGFALGKIFGVDKFIDSSILARFGSGSACRSVYGGFVKWIKGWDSIEYE